MTHTLHPLAEAYLERLDRAAAHLPRSRRRELVDEIVAHLVEALGPEPTDADVRNALDRLGTPEEIADAESPGPPAIAPPSRMATREWAAVLLLPLGGFVFGVGWFAGVILLWASPAWSTLDKLIGTLAIPGGLAVAASLWSSYLISTSESVAIVDLVPLVGVTAVPIITATYLARVADSNRRS
jgi:hypothetical protein